MINAKKVVKNSYEAKKTGEKLFVNNEGEVYVIRTYGDVTAVNNVIGIKSIHDLSANLKVGIEVSYALENLKILNQDRDFLYEIKKGEKIIIVEKKRGPISIAYNLELEDNSVIGSFDTLKEASEELNEIENCGYPFYVVSGFSNYK